MSGPTNPDRQVTRFVLRRIETTWPRLGISASLAQSGAPTPAPVSFTVDAKRSRMLDLAGNDDPDDARRGTADRRRDERRPVVKVFALLPGPAPVLTGVSPAIGPSDGGYKVTLNGVNLFVVNSIGVGTQLGFIDENDARADNQIRFTVPFGCAGSAKDIVAYSIDIAISPIWKGTLPNSFTYSPIPVQVAPGDFNDNLENGTLTTLSAIGESRSVTGRYAIGPPNCADLVFTTPVVSGCAAASVSITPDGIAYNQKGVFNVTVTVLAGTCAAGATYTGTIKFTLRSTEPGASSREITVPYSVTR